MRSPILVAALLLLPVATARAEYAPGFSLYGHAAAERILEVEMGDGGAVTVTAVWKGKGAVGDVVKVDPELLARTRHDGDGRRAFLFLAGDRPILDEAGIAWVRDGKVMLLPDNWAWGIAWSADYRHPTPEVLRESIRTVMKDIAEVGRIAGLDPGRERALAASALLARPRRGLDWYAIRGSSVGILLDLPWDERWDELKDYSDELRKALGEALGKIPPGEKAVWKERIAALPPGSARSQHLEILLRAGVGPDDYELMKRVHETSADLRESLASARALFKARPEEALPVLLREMKAGTPELALGVLEFLGRAAREGRVPADAVLDATVRLAGEVLVLPRDIGVDNLGYGICGALAAGKRDADRAVLLALARSEHTCRAQALVNLKAWTGRGWEADDERWDRLVDAD